MITRTTLLLLLVGASAHAGAWQPTADEAAAIKALSVRHGAPGCDALVTMLPDGAPSLVHIVDHVDSPPWVAIRAAHCATRLPAAHADVARWLSLADHAGIARVVATVLPELDAEVARSLLVQALAGPHADRVRSALASDDRVQARALLVSP